MSIINSGFASLPGMGTVVETFESAYCFGPYPRYFTGAYIGSTASDPDNSPTYVLRMGLVMGKITSTGAWVNYDATATDGSEVAQGVLVESIRMQDAFSGTNQARFYAIMISGGVQSAKLIGLDGMARQQLANRFYFDDDLPGGGWYEWKRFQNKTANYTVLASDNFTLFTTDGDADAITFTLPTLAPGLMYGFFRTVNQNMTVTSAAGNDIITRNDLAASSVAFSTGSQLIGSMLVVYSNPGGTYWVTENRGGTTATIT